MTDLSEIKNKILELAKKYCEHFFKEKEFIPGTSSIPVSGKVVDFEEISNLINSSLDAWLTTGRFNSEFQKQLASFLGVKIALTVNSGSSANLLAFSSLTSDRLGERKINPGDEVITCATGFPTTIAPIIQNGAIPVFIDATVPNYNINTEIIEKALTKKTKAIMLAHALGNPFDVDAIVDICKKKNLWLIEDNCDALGSKYNNKYTGSFGDIATQSFYPAHHITMGEGGAVITNNIKLKRIIESFRDWGRDCYCETGKDNTCNKRFKWQLGDLPFGYDHKYTYTHLGYNLKITDMQASIGLAQLKKLSNFIEIRKKNFNFLYNSLNEFSDIFYLPEATKKSNPSWFGFPLTIKEESNIKRADLINFLESRKIGTRLLFAGNVTKQPFIKNYKFEIHGDLNMSDLIMKNTFWIGLYPGLSKEKLSYVVQSIKDYIKK